MDVFSVQRSSQMISESLSSVAAALENGELEIAESKLNEILATVPNSPEALNLSGLVSLRLGNCTSAIYFFRDAVFLDKDSAIYLLHFGSVLVMDGRLKKAVSAYSRFLRDYPDNPNVIFRIGERFFTFR